MTEPTTGAPESGGPTEYRRRKRSTGTIIAIIAVVAAAAIIAVLAFALNKGNGGGGAPTPPDAGSQNDGGGGTASGELAVGLQLEPTNLDIRSTAGVALDQILIDNVYEGLVGLAPGSVSEYVPVLASALPSVSDDGLTYTFALRDGAVFASGSALTAQDVVDSLSATLTEDLLGTAATVTSPDAGTVVITLAKPNSQLLWQLANRPGLVFESAFTGDLANETNGTGPYTLESWKQGDSISFVPNEHYAGPNAATLSRVVWRYIPDPNAAINAAKEGDVDVLAPVASSLVSQLEGDADFALGRAASTDVFTLAYNSAKAPFDDVRVRTALSKAIDGDAIVAAFYGDGKELGGPITDIEAAYEDLTDVNAYDPGGAKALLAEAGVENLKLTVTIPNFYGTEAINQVVTDFKAVGVTLKVKSVEFAAWLDEVYMNHDYDLSYINHAEPNDFANYVNPGYYFGEVNDEAAALYAQSLAATDPAQATDLLKQAARVVAEDAPAKWLINYTPTNAIGTNVHGFPTSNTNSRISLSGVTIG